MSVPWRTTTRCRWSILIRVVRCSTNHTLKSVWIISDCLMLLIYCWFNNQTDKDCRLNIKHLFYFWFKDRGQNVTDRATNRIHSLFTSWQSRALQIRGLTDVMSQKPKESACFPDGSVQRTVNLNTHHLHVSAVFWAPGAGVNEVQEEELRCLSAPHKNKSLLFFFISWSHVTKCSLRQEGNCNISNFRHPKQKNNTKSWNVS